MTEFHFFFNCQRKTRCIPKQLEKIGFWAAQKLPRIKDRKRVSIKTIQARLRSSGVWTNFGLRRTAATSSDLTSSSSIYCVY